MTITTITFTSGGPTSVYIWQTGATTYYNTSFTQSGATEAFWPITIQRTGIPPSPGTYAYIYFSSNLSGDNNMYFNMSTHNVIIDGQNNTVSINSLAVYPSFVDILDNISNYDITVQNLGIMCNQELQNLASGWIFYNSNDNQSHRVTACHAYYCYSTGPINANSGGIFGGNCSECTARNCFSTGTINENAGGIFGHGCSDCTAANCYSKGTISGSNAGGIFGHNSGKGSMDNVHPCSAINCYSTGAINGQDAGGIFGAGVNYVCTATNCYSTGAINGQNAGGIFGSGVNGSCSATNCYTSGYSNNNQNSRGGIYGGNYQDD